MDNLQLSAVHKIFSWATGLLLLIAAIPNSKVLWCFVFKCTKNAFSLVGMSLWAAALAFLAGVVLFGFGLFSGYLFLQNREEVYRKYAIGSGIVLLIIAIFWFIVALA